MPEKDQDNNAPPRAKRKKSIWLAIVIVLTLTAAFFLWYLQDSRSADERLAEIEAARAIPDSDNAALIYYKLILEPYPPSVDEDQYITDKLFEAARLEKCRFPIIPGPESAMPHRLWIPAMKRWVPLLRNTAENDLTDGRVDEAVSKWKCILQMADHLRQQPLFSDYTAACAIEAIPLHDARVFVVEGDATDAHLKLVEAMPVYTEDRWPEALAQITPVIELVERKFTVEELGRLDRIRSDLEGLFRRASERNTESLREINRRLLTTSRGLHILIALRRYKNKHARWPQNLDQIKSQVPPEALIDPANNGPFLYMLAADAFELYSTGPNKIDENGKYEPDGDDWPIWPPYKTKPKQKNTATQPPDPNKSETK